MGVGARSIECLISRDTALCASTKSEISCLYPVAAFTHKSSIAEYNQWTTESFRAKQGDL
jgi:hypothetical protein